MIANGETEKVVTWLRREAKQGTGLVALVHQNVGGFGASIGKWPVAEHDTDAVLEQIAHDLYRAACDDADGQSAPGPQQYFAHFFGESDLRTPASRLPFLVVAARQAALGPPGEGVATEPPTQSGFIGHVMRHSDTAQRQAWTITGHALGMIERHASMVSQENSYLRQSNFELARGYEGLLSERHIRELAAQTAIHDRHERSQFWNRMWLLAPAVVSRVMGGPPSGPRALPAPSAALPPPPYGALPPAGSAPAGPATYAAGESAAPAPVASPAAPVSQPAPGGAPDPLIAIQIRALFDSLSMEQLAALQSTLSNEQFLALGAIYSALPQAAEGPPAPPPASEGAS